jgi:hypothetical protein
MVLPPAAEVFEVAFASRPDVRCGGLADVRVQLDVRGQVQGDALAAGRHEV